MRAGWIMSATDAGVDLDRFPAPNRLDITWIFIDGPPDWSMADEWATRYQQQPCRACGSEEIRGRYYCSRCDHTGLDGRINFPGLPPDSCRDPLWQAEPTIYAPDSELAGGVEAKPAKVRRGVARARHRRKAG